MLMARAEEISPQRTQSSQRGAEKRDSIGEVFGVGLRSGDWGYGDGFCSVDYIVRGRPEGTPLQNQFVIEALFEKNIARKIEGHGWWPCPVFF